MTLSTITYNTKDLSESRFNQIDWDNLKFGKEFSDHMFVMEYSDGAWKQGEIVPFSNIPMHPAMSAIHYGQSIFEGLKAYRGVDGKIRIFRPDMNAKRFAESAKRMSMPELPENVFVEAIKKLIKVDQDWVVDREGYSLYIRPFMFATDELVGIKPADNYKFMIITSPVGLYYSEPVRVLIEEHYTRAALGGVGRAKAAGNYAASLYPASLAKDKGFHQLLWTDSAEHKYIEESGTMNVVFELDGKLISPAEDSDTILRGITKRSVLEIAKSWGVEVEERKISVKEITDALKTNRIKDAFGAGTAATIAHFSVIGFGDEIYELPPIESRSLSLRIKKYLEELKSGNIQDNFDWVQFV